MKLDWFIRRLLPRDDKFYSLLEDSTRNLLQASEIFQKLSTSKSMKEREKIVRQIKNIEHRGDDVAHKIFSELNGTFVTPIDREDIHHLASSLDDILDHIDGSASRFTVYKIKKVPKNVDKLIDILHDSIIEIHRGVGLLRDLHQFEELEKVLKKVNEYENEADRVFDHAVSDLFENEKNPVQIIKLKEIYVGLETATDKCEDAANVLESILIKQA